MIGYLNGEILEINDGRVLLGIGDRQSSGLVGYAVHVPQSLNYVGFSAGKRVELFVYTHVREEALDLYGFSTSFEKNLFLLLLSVNGIGPKSALGMLSKVEPAQLVDAILSGDQSSLTQVPGVGKKTAERVVLELKDNLRKKIENGAFGDVGRSDSSKKVVPSVGKSSGAGAQSQRDVRDAKDALVGLGFREQDIQSLLDRLMLAEGFVPNGPEDLIRTALRHLT